MGSLSANKAWNLRENILDPVEKMTSPCNRSEERSVLGIFNQSRHFFERYDKLSSTYTTKTSETTYLLWNHKVNVHKYDKTHRQTCS